MPRGVYVRTEAHRVAYRKRSAQDSYKKAQEAAWTPERRAASSTFFSEIERTPGWRSNIATAAKDWHEKNRESWEQKVGKLTPLERALRNRLKMYKWNAARENHPWLLTDEQARCLFLKNCHYCGVAPGEGGRSSKQVAILLHGIDRADNTKGYDLQNSLTACWMCNRAKGARNEHEFIDWVKKIAGNYNFFRNSQIAGQ